tara:strand:+ start:1505 stop:1840 length:336 start_codon:yes stop_codon:yes gene_type:complete
MNTIIDGTIHDGSVIIRMSRYDQATNSQGERFGEFTITWDQYNAMKRDIGGLHGVFRYSNVLGRLILTKDDRALMRRDASWTSSPYDATTRLLVHATHFSGGKWHQIVHFS